MFEEFNEYGAVHYGSLGRKAAAYNTRLKKSMLVEENQGKYKTNVLVHPYFATDFEKRKLQQKAEQRKSFPEDRRDYRQLLQQLMSIAETEQEGRIIHAYISEPVAAVLYYTSQNPESKWGKRIRVLNVHKDRTDITFVNIGENGITVESQESFFRGGELLEGKLMNFYTKKLRLIDGDVLNYAKERHVLRNYMKDAAFRITSNRQEEDKFTFTSPQTGKAYQLSIKRREFDELIGQVADEILKRLESIDQHCYGTILCGGLAEYEAFSDLVRAKYENAPVMSYKAHEAEVLGAAIYARQVYEARSNQ